MTLFELLDELEQVDLETYRKWFNDYDVLGLDQWQLDSLQGCIQRACERRKWGMVIEWSMDGGPYEWSAYIGHEEPPGAFKAAYSWSVRYYGDSPAEALLAAYIAAVKEEKQ